MQHLMNTYARLPVAFVKGDGAWLYDESNRAYLDAISGIAVCSLGHANPEIAQALCDQANTLVHTSNLYEIPLQTQLGERLCDASGMDKVFFCNSGAEANETAIKLARRWGHSRGIETPTIVVMNNSFHGRTLAALSATGNPKAQAGFEPLVEGFIPVPYDDLAAVEALSDNPNIVAVLVEPVQGEGGVHIPADTYLPGLRALCDRNNWLLMVDEVQTGMGRTGKLFAFQHSDIQPDVMTLAKALGNGVPIGACLARGEAADVLVPGSHGTTFGGNPLACRAGLTVLNIMQRDDWPARVAEMGKRLREQFEARLADNPNVRAIRVKGLMIGIELDRPAGELVKRALEDYQLLINVTRDTVVRLLPPFVINASEQQQIVEATCELIETL
ncbi:acetylornithine aminotransferase apoenzyme [Sulfurivirga caldicuralii]|uniref:Acetylornithine aminotransferase n=1 Tax=Sulfurivirga caldicuralii TaxID=364032 RepID=A0A1N6DYJ4_9GAMM|nr:aspartate aminotransferase family protein [Sulfurivirga caldicuralii]SIN75850.1 acetylornithine aminotransferase apoenzyme [Sulfurivirga caldicuralii]